MPQNSSNSNNAFNVNSDGNVNNNNVGAYQYAVRPVVYLTSAVQITGGDGTESNPYQLGL